MQNVASPSLVNSIKSSRDLFERAERRQIASRSRVTKMAAHTTEFSIATHLSDRALTPLISTSQSSSSQQRSSQVQAQALTALSSTAIAAYDSASRLGLGLPQRIMIETNSAGPVILHSYLNPQPRLSSRTARSMSIVEQTRNDLRPLSGSKDSERASEQRFGTEGPVNGVGDAQTENAAEAEEETLHQPPLLVATVISASASEMTHARRAAARLERTGKEFQREWERQQEGSQAKVQVAEDG